MEIANALIYIVVLIIVVILIIVLIQFLKGILIIAPFAYAQEDTEQKTVDKVETTVNDTDVTITCTSNIPDLVSCD